MGISWKIFFGRVSLVRRLNYATFTTTTAVQGRRARWRPSRAGGRGIRARCSTHTPQLRHPHIARSAYASTHAAAAVYAKGVGAGAVHDGFHLRIRTHTYIYIHVHACIMRRRRRRRRRGVCDSAVIAPGYTREKGSRASAAAAEGLIFEKRPQKKTSQQPTNGTSSFYYYIRESIVRV